MEDMGLIINRMQSPVRFSVLMGITVFLGLFFIPMLGNTQESNEETPRISYLTPHLPLAQPEKQATALSVRGTSETGDASLYIGLQEVIKIRSSYGGYTPQERVTAIYERLDDYLKQDGNPRDIKPGHEGRQVVIRAGRTVLLTVDPETARRAGLTTKQLAFQWTNMLRRALGAEPLQRDVNLIASRGITPTLSFLRDKSASTGVVLKGFASWYGPGFHGRRTASGERFNMHALTAAHRTLPLNSRVRVTNAWTGKSAVVRITDRGPFIRGRIIDLSKGAAQAVGMLSSGTAPVVVEVMGR